MTFSRRTLLRLGALSSLPVLALAQAPAAKGAALPLKYVGPATSPEITPGDLMTRLYAFADDSMMGRKLGTEYNDKGTAFIEREVRKLGLVPAGDNGTYFQKVPVGTRGLDSMSTIRVGDSVLRAGADFVAVSEGKPKVEPAIRVMYVGLGTDTMNIPSADSVRGKYIMLRPPMFPPAAAGMLQGSAAYKALVAMQRAAAGLVYIMGDQIPPFTVRFAMQPTNAGLLRQEETAPILLVSTRAANVMLGAAVATAAKGTTSGPVALDVRFNEVQLPGRNVVAVLPGSDAKLKGQYIAIGAHNDHVGFRTQGPLDHDSVKAYMQVVRPQGADSPNRAPTGEEAARVKALIDSLHQAHGARPDSIYNGADDDGSGSMAVLEIAEAFSKLKLAQRPKKSLLFIWHTGEEAGLFGSEHFTDYPTVPRDSVIAELNMDMVGRGGASDITGEDKAGGLLKGGPGYVQLVGSRRLSTELGDLIEKVNVDRQLGLNFDYAMDANGHPQNIYCRSDHYEYARYGIPIVFVTTGGHADYHQVTDEPQYIDYGRMAGVSRLIFETALALSLQEKRPVVDKPKPDPKGECVQ